MEGMLTLSIGHHDANDGDDDDIMDGYHDNHDDEDDDYEGFCQS